MIKEAPIKFVPYLKSVIWGGNKICEYKGIKKPEPKIGESWEISEVPGHESIVSEGLYKGLSLSELIDRYGEELMGKKVMTRYGRRFPLLIKFIDANDNLSVQVHPDDDLAMERHNCLGKTEMWYIIQADEGSKIYAGLNEKITPDEYVRRVEKGTFFETLSVYDSSPGDIFYLPAGRVHAIGAGNLLAEIQESSDITYRIFDFNRRDSNGNLRELHTELAKDAIDFNSTADNKVIQPSSDITNSEIITCKHFTTNRIIIDGATTLKLSSESFTVLMCIKGNLKLYSESGETIFNQGSTVLLPAALPSIEIKGFGSLLSIKI